MWSLIRSVFIAILCIPVSFSALVSVDMHSHGEHSDIPGTLDDSIAWHKKRGFDAMAITNHDYLTPPNRIQELEDKHEYSILPGIEWSSYDTHLLGFFDPETYEQVYTDIMNDTVGKYNLISNSGRCISTEYRLQFINLMHSYGGYVSVAHPTLTLLERISNIKSYSTLPCDIPGLLSLKQLSIDAVEVANTIPDVMADDFASYYSLPKTAGTDLHKIEEGMVVAKTIVDIGSSPVSSKSIFYGIRTGNITIEYSSWWNILSDDIRMYVIIGISSLISIILVSITIIVLSCVGCHHMCCEKTVVSLPVVK